MAGSQATLCGRKKTGLGTSWGSDGQHTTLPLQVRSLVGEHAARSRRGRQGFSNGQQGLKAAGEGGNLTPQAQRTEAPRELLRHRGPGSPHPTL